MVFEGQVAKNTVIYSVFLTNVKKHWYYSVFLTNVKKHWYYDVFIHTVT